MSPTAIRDTLQSLSNRELTLLWHALPLPIRGCLSDALHAHLDELAAELDDWFPEATS